MEALAIGSRRGYWVVMLMGALGFVTCGVFMVVTGKSPLVGWMNIVFFGGCTLVFTRQLLDIRPRLVIDDRGILHSGTATATATR